MATNAAGIIFSNLNDNTLSRMTAERTVAAIPFACRYRLVDFCLSNLVNADISNISIIANYNYRALAEHIGSGKDWDLARRNGGVRLISPYSTARSGAARLYSTHMEALKNMREYIRDLGEEYVIIMDSDNVLNIDLHEVLNLHKKTDANITMVTMPVGKDFSSKHPRLMISSVAGKVTDIALSSTYKATHPEVSLTIWVMRTDYLLGLIDEADAYNLDSLTNMLIKNFRHMNIRSYCYTGYVASVSSFLDYYRCSIELTTNEKARESLLWKESAPIFTRVHNSAPTVYSANAKVSDSMIADDCVIEGEVINSVLFRGVKVGRGAVIRDSVLFAGTTVGKNASLTSIVTDEDVVVSDGTSLAGNLNMPFYIQRGRKV